MTVNRFFFLFDDAVGYGAFHSAIDRAAAFFLYVLLAGKPGDRAVRFRDATLLFGWAIEAFPFFPLN